MRTWHSAALVRGEPHSGHAGEEMMRHSLPPAGPVPPSGRPPRGAVTLLALLLLQLKAPGGLPQQPQHAAPASCAAPVGAGRSVWLSEVRASPGSLELELTALAGMNLASWSVVGYDARTGSCYACTRREAFLSTRTTVMPNEAALGMGALRLLTLLDAGEATPDAVALFDGLRGELVELISWGGAPFVAADGPAVGAHACSVASAAVASQAAVAWSSPDGPSLQLQRDPSAWVITAAPSWDQLNPLMPTPLTGRVTDLTARSVWINEILHSVDAGGDNVRVEIAGQAGADLTGWFLEYYNSASGGGGGNCGADHPVGTGGGGAGGGGVSGNGCPSYARRLDIATTVIPDEVAGSGAVEESVTGLPHGPVSGVALLRPGAVIGVGAEVVGKLSEETQAILILQFDFPWVFLRQLLGGRLCVI